MGKLKEKCKNFYGSIKDRSKFLSNLKVVLVLILIELYTIIYEQVIGDSVFIGNQQVLVAAGLAILFTLIFAVIDGIIESQRLEEINENNKIISREIFNMRYNMERLNEEQDEINRLGSKYETCWKTLKVFAEPLNHGKEFIEVMNKIENLAQEQVDKHYDNMKNKGE